LDGLRKKLFEVLSEKHKKEGDTPTIAYTHLIPAKQVIATSYFMTWLNLLAIQTSIDIPVRGFKGSVGDMHLDLPDVMKMLSNANTELHKTLDVNIEPEVILTQTWMQLSALLMITKIMDVALIANKRAQDFRYLIILGMLKRKSKDKTASSTLVHKQTNPDKFERIIGLMRMVISDCNVMLNTLLNQGLARTLDDSSVYRESLPRCFNFLAFSLDSLIKNVDGFRFEKHLMNENTSYDVMCETMIMEEVLESKGTKSRIELDLKARGL
jgi:adenylosuccinate lyase